MPETLEEIRAERRKLKAEFSQLYDALAVLLFRLDPISINYGHNNDEYEPEVGTILPRLNECQTESDVCRVVHEEFAHWFGEDTAGPPDHYVTIAAEIWPLWLKLKPA